MIKTISSVILLLTLLIAPFLTSALNEQSPFEFIKLFVLSIVTILIFGIYLVTTLKERLVEIRWNRGLTLVGLILVVNTLSLAFSNNPVNSFWADINVPSDSLLTIIIFFIFCFLCIQFFVSEAESKKVSYTLAAAATLLAGYGIIQHFGLDPVDWWGYSQMAHNAYGTIGQAVGFGTILGAILGTALMLYLQSVGKWTQILLLAANLVILLGIMYSGSRGPALAAIFMTIFGLVIFIFRNRNFIALKKCGWFVIIFGLSQIIYFFENDTTTLTKKLSSNVIESGLSERTYIWQDALTIWKKYPILGAGPETFGTEQKAVNRKEHNQYEHWELTWTKAHNHYIHHLATTGLLGLLAELALIFFVVIDFWKLLKKPKFESEDLDSIGFALGLFFLCVTNLTAFNFVLTQLYSYLLPSLYFLSRSRNSQKIIRIDSKKPVNLVILLLSLGLLAQLLFSVYSYWKADVLFGKAKREFLLEKNAANALKAIDEAIVVQSYNPRLYCRKATIITALLTNNPNKYSQAEVTDTVKLIDEISDTCVNLDLTNAENWTIKGKLFSELFFNRFIDDPEISEKSFYEAIRVNPNNPTYYYRLALLYLNTNRIDDYIKNMRLAIELKQDFLPAYTDLLGFYYRRGQTLEVETLVQTLAKLKIDKGEYIAEFGNMINLAEINKDQKSKAILINIYSGVRYLGEIR